MMPWLFNFIAVLLLFMAIATSVLSVCSYWRRDVVTQGWDRGGAGWQLRATSGSAYLAVDFGPSPWRGTDHFSIPAGPARHGLFRWHRLSGGGFTVAVPQWPVVLLLLAYPTWWAIKRRCSRSARTRGFAVSLPLS